MIKVCVAFVFAIAGILLVGLLNLSIANVVVVFAAPFVFLFKLLGNRPLFFVYAAFIAAFAGGLSTFFGYIVTPIEYYYSIWGWVGIVAGIIAAILLPLELFLFLSVAFFKGGAGVYLGQFFGGICFGISGFLLYVGATSQSPWRWLSKLKGKTP